MRTGQPMYGFNLNHGEVRIAPAVGVLAAHAGRVLLLERLDEGLGQLSRPQFGFLGRAIDPQPCASAGRPRRRGGGVALRVVAARRFGVGHLCV